MKLKNAKHTGKPWSAPAVSHRKLCSKDNSLSSLNVSLSLFKTLVPTYCSCDSWEVQWFCSLAYWNFTAFCWSLRLTAGDSCGLQSRPWVLAHYQVKKSEAWRTFGPHWNGHWHWADATARAAEGGASCKPLSKKKNISWNHAFTQCIWHLELHM